MWAIWCMAILQLILALERTKKSKRRTLMLITWGGSNPPAKWKYDPTIKAWSASPVDVHIEIAFVQKQRLEKLVYNQYHEVRNGWISMTSWKQLVLSDYNNCSYSLSFNLIEKWTKLSPHYSQSTWLKNPTHLLENI